MYRAAVQEPPGPHDPDRVIIPVLLTACPSFGVRWTERLAESPQLNDQGVYVDVGEFATHLVELLGRDETAEFPSLFAAVEHLFVDGDAGIRNALKYGLIEGIGNVASHQGWQFAGRFRPWLGPAATKAWDELHEEWGTSDSGDIRDTER
jgi:hypothetical protein